MWLEHINLVVGCKEKAIHFYLDFLGLTADASKSFHVNLGQQQFHLSENGDPAQRMCGSIGLAVPDLNTVRARVSDARGNLEGTHFSILADAQDYLTVRCPWGNIFHLYSCNDDPSEPVCESPQKMVMMHSEGGAYGPGRMAVRGKPGIRFVEVTCCPGSTQAIARFYEQVLTCTVTRLSHGRIAVSVGPGVHFVFVEHEDAMDYTDMAGVHICVYAADFRGLYKRLADRSLVWTNPRFTHLDSCDTWEEALGSRTLRFKELVDMDTGDMLLELEHETRPLGHGQFLKVPNYEPK